MSLRLAFLALLAGVTAPVAAADPSACSVPANLEGTPLAAWAKPDGDATGPLTPDHPVTLAIEVGAASRGLSIESAGRYGIAADGGVWIDLIGKGAPLASVDHSHGPACSGIRKIVWFDVAAGDYSVALSKAALARIRLLVVRTR